MDRGEAQDLLVLRFFFCVGWVGGGQIRTNLRDVIYVNFYVLFIYLYNFLFLAILFPPQFNYTLDLYKKHSFS